MYLPLSLKVFLSFGFLKVFHIKKLFLSWMETVLASGQTPCPWLQSSSD